MLGVFVHGFPEQARFLSPLSEQQLADSDTVGSTFQDGLMDNGFDSVEKNAMFSEGRSRQMTIPRVFDGRRVSFCEPELLRQLGSRGVFTDHSHSALSPNFQL